MLRSARMSFLRLIVVGVLLGAGATRADLKLPVTAVVTNTAQTLDDLRDDVTTKMQHVTRSLDSFFKRPDAPETISNSTARLRLGIKVKDADGVSFQSAFNGKLAMPYAEERLHLFADNIKRGALPGAENPTVRDDGVQVGARWWLLNRLRSHLHLEGGVKFHGIPDPFALLEFEYERKLAGWVGRLTQDGFYYVKEGAGELTQVDFERRFRDNSFFRSTTALNYTETTYGVELEQTVFYEYPLPGRHRKLIPSASLFAHKCGNCVVDNYRVNMVFRTGFFRPWLVLEVTPQIEFPRERDYALTSSILVGFEIWLGTLPEDK